ncbi:MAG TPA: glucoamylase family protein, partial [Kiritimatiellia bacterium]
RDTWNYIDAFLAPETGFPHDNNSREGKTNTTNLGMYLASLCMAYKLGYVTEEHAVARITKILDSLDTFDHWNRLYPNWLDPLGVSRTAEPGPSNISDYNKLPAGLIVVRQTFPQLAGRCTEFLDAIPWEVFHEKESGAMYYEFDVVEKSVRNPVYFYRGEDKILGHFLAIASGKVPPETWSQHDMSEEEKYGYSYYLHGWQGGGLFMQYICGLFLDDRGTKLGHSAANFAWAQQVHALKIGAPVWGWSACVGPDERYRGMGGMEDAIVTPHASALAINLFPREVVDNLRRLEAMGLRRPCVVDGRTERFGFTDSINWQNGEISKAYLVLDQAMLFLSLVNFCEDGLLWKTFGADPMIRHGKEVVSDYAQAAEHRAEEQDYIASLTWEEPGVAWLGSDAAGRSITVGQPVQRELWARSLSASPLVGVTQTWSVADASGKVIDQGAFTFDLAPRQSVNVGEISVPSDAVVPGSHWVFSGKLKLGGYNLQAHNETIVFPSYCRLEGDWKLREGNAAEWSSPELDDTAWTRIAVPSRWENGPLPGYDGFAWYRHTFTVPVSKLKDWGDKALAIALGRIDDADETFLNGVKIGGEGAFPPDSQTAFNSPRLYPVDRALLRDSNVIAVHVSDWGGFGGIWGGLVAIGPAEELQQALDESQ